MSQKQITKNVVNVRREGGTEKSPHKIQQKSTPVPATPPVHVENKFRGADDDVDAIHEVEHALRDDGQHEETWVRRHVVFCASLVYLQ